MKELFIKVLNEFETDARKSDLDAIKIGYPFHVLFFDSKGLLAFKLERRLVTKMGTILYPKLAKIIAEDRCQDVHREYQITGELTVSEIAAIDRIVTALRAPKPRGGVKRRPDHYREIAEIESQRKRSSETSNVTIQADLFIGDHEEGPLFLEIEP